MSNHSGSYMLNSLLAMLERESYFSRVSPEKTTEFVSHVLGLAMDQDGNPGEVLDGIGERLGIARAGRASCSRAMSPCSRGSTSTTAGTGRNATRWYGWTLAAAASRSPACWAKDSNGRAVTSSWSFETEASTDTDTGSISVRERALGIEVAAAGHITGSGDHFTTYIQSEQDLSAQLSQLKPALAQQLGVYEIDVSALASGRRTAAGNLADLSTLTAVTAFHCPGLYDLAVEAGADPSTVRQTIERVANSWYLASSSATNRGTCQQ